MSLKCNAVITGRNGKPDRICGADAYPNGKCIGHGGKSTGPKNCKGNTNAVKHGIFKAGFEVKELKYLDGVKPGTPQYWKAVTEIKMARSLHAEQVFDETNMPLVESETTANGGDDSGSGSLMVKEKRARPDFDRIYHELSGRYLSFEKHIASLPPEKEEENIDQDKININVEMSPEDLEKLTEAERDILLKFSGGYKDE